MPHSVKQLSEARDELSDVRMKLKVVQKLYETEQKNSLKSFTSVGNLRQELSEANSIAMQARVEHMERVRELEAQVKDSVQANKTAENRIEQLQDTARRAESELRRVTERAARKKAQEKATSLEIAEQLREVVQTERLLQSQNQQVVKMLQSELNQQSKDANQV